MNSFDFSELNLGWLAGIAVLIGVGVLQSRGWIDAPTADTVKGLIAGAALIHTAPKVAAKVANAAPEEDEPPAPGT